MDGGTSSDPYCKVTLGKEKAKTKVINNTLNPKRREAFVSIRPVSLSTHIPVNVLSLPGTHPAQIRPRQCRAHGILKGDDEDPYVKGYEDLLSIYNWAVKKIIFSGPTHFSGVLDNLYRRI